MKAQPTSGRPASFELARRCPPFASFEVSIEGDGCLRLHAWYGEDRSRLATWLAHPATRSRLLRQFADGLEGLAAA
jgi:hypothetical protein